MQFLPTYPFWPWWQPDRQSNFRQCLSHFQNDFVSSIFLFSSTDRCKWIGMCLTFCLISFAFSVSCILTSSPFTVWFSFKSFLNCILSTFTSGSSLLLFICYSVLSLSSVFPNSFILSDPSNGFVSFVVTSISNCYCFSFMFTVVVVFPSKLIRLSFTSLYSVSKGYDGVMLLNCDLGNKVTGEPLPMMNLIGRSC